MIAEGSRIRVQGLGLRRIGERERRETTGYEPFEREVDLACTCSAVWNSTNAIPDLREKCTFRQLNKNGTV